MAIRRSRAARAVVLVGVGAALACGGGVDSAGPDQPSPAAEVSPSPRNPFGLARDVPDCCGADVQAFADQAPALGAPSDPNAEPWAGTAETKTHASIEGEWSSRWMIRGQDWVEGKAVVRIVGDRVFIHYTDAEADSGDHYLIEARRDGDRLIGRYIHPGYEKDTSPWVGTVVDNRRIDGVYLMGRWDFRRAGAIPDSDRR